MQDREPKPINNQEPKQKTEKQIADEEDKRVQDGVRKLERAQHKAQLPSNAVIDL